MAEVFVSCASTDRHRLRPLVKALRARGYDVWWYDNIGPGEVWADAIAREIRNATTVIVALSKDGERSQHLRDETELAREAGRVIVPILLDTVELPLSLR